MEENNVINKAVRSDVYKIDPRAINVVEGFNSRIDFGDIEELARQIAEQGVLNPISVKKIDDEHYELIDGERRYRAVMYNLEHGVEIARIPALILPKNMRMEEMLLQQIMRNEGKSFNEYEYGIAYDKMVKIGKTNAEIAKMVGKNRWHIDCCLSHLRRDERIQDLLRDNKIKGTEVRRVYQAHHNEEDAVKEILNAVKRHQEKVDAEAEMPQSNDTKNSKVSIKDKAVTIGELDAMESKTIAKRDTASIKKGLNLLFKYYNRITNNGEIPMALDIVEVVGQLNGNVERTIIDVLNEAKEEAKLAV